MSVALVSVALSVFVTLVVIAPNAVDVAATPVVPLLTVDASAVMSVALVLIEPSAVVTLVVNAPWAADVAATPVVTSLTVDSSVVMSAALVLTLPSAIVTRVVSAVAALAFAAIKPSALVRSDCRVVISLDAAVTPSSVITTRASSALVASDVAMPTVSLVWRSMAVPSSRSRVSSTPVPSSSNLSRDWISATNETTSVLVVLRVPSAVVTLVVNAACAADVAATPVVASSTVVSRSTTSLATVVTVPSSVTTVASKMASADAVAVCSPSTVVRSVLSCVIDAAFDPMRESNKLTQAEPLQ